MTPADVTSSVAPSQAKAERPSLDPSTGAPSPSDGLSARFARGREAVTFAARRAADLRLPQVAGSLTFTTVLALVPMLVVALAVFTAFPLFGEYRIAIEKLLLRNLMPDQFSAMILRNLNEFATKAGRLGALGLLGLVVTALVMILTVDRVLNDIWNVDQRRRLSQRILVYWALVTIGPVLVGGSLTLTSWLSSSAGMEREMPATVRLLLDWVPVVLSGLAWSALYVYVPNRSVAWRDALVGGFTAAMLFEFMSRGFTGYIARGGVLTVYGAFAAVPVFLIWIYLSWLAILFGATLAATLPVLRLTRFTDQARAGDGFVTAAALVLALHARRLGEPPGETSTQALAWAVRTCEEDVERMLRVLEALGYVCQLARKPKISDRHLRWLLVADPATTTLAPLYSKLALDPANSLLARDPVGLGRWIDMSMNSDWLRQPIGRIAAPLMDVEAPMPDGRSGASVKPYVKASS